MTRQIQHVVAKQCVETKHAIQDGASHLGSRRGPLHVPIETCASSRVAKSTEFVRDDTSSWAFLPKQPVGVAPSATVEPPPASLWDQWCLGKKAEPGEQMKSDHCQDGCWDAASMAHQPLIPSTEATAFAALDELHHPGQGHCVIDPVVPRSWFLHRIPLGSRDFVINFFSENTLKSLCGVKRSHGQFFGRAPACDTGVGHAVPSLLPCHGNGHEHNRFQRGHGRKGSVAGAKSSYPGTSEAQCRWQLTKSGNQLRMVGRFLSSMVPNRYTIRNVLVCDRLTLSKYVAQVDALPPSRPSYMKAPEGPNHASDVGNWCLFSCWSS